MLGIDITNWIQTNLSPNQAYTNYVMVQNSNGFNTSQIDIKYTLTAPPKKLILSILSNNKVLLNWETGSGGNTRYCIQQAIGNSVIPSVWSNIVTWGDNLTITEYTDIILIPETNYWYRVLGYNGDGIITTNCKETNIFIPAIPTNFTGIGVFTNKILWSWNDNSIKETNYSVLDIQHINISGLLGSNSTYWTQKNLIPNNCYTNYVMIMCEYGNLYSGYNIAYTYAKSPYNLIVNKIDGTTTELKWDHTGATAYAIERANDINGSPTNWTVIANFTNNITTLTYKDETCAPNTTYWYRIKSYNGGGILNPQPSNEIKITTQTANNLNNVVFAPNPVNIRNDSYAIFYNLTLDSTIKIYTIKGRLVKEMISNDGKGKYTWDLRDRNNNKIIVYL